MPLMRRFRLWLVFAAVVVAAGLAGARFVNRQSRRVAVARVQLGALESWITTNGTVEPSEPHVMSAPVSAFISAVRVVEGQKVSRGDLLLTLDVAPQRADLARAREELAKAQNELRVLESGGPIGERAQVDADLRKAEADIAQLQRARGATERLIAKQAATRDELDQTQLALTRAEATRDALARRTQELERDAALNLEVGRLAVRRASETVKLLETQVDSAAVRSPIDGTIYALPARAGNRVELGAVLARLANLRSVQVRAFVDEPDLAWVHEGQSVEVSWSAVPNRIWTGRTDRMAKSVVSRGDRMVGEVICSVENENQQLIPNLGVDVRIRAELRARTRLVPRQAVRTDQAGRYVFVVRNHTLERRAIVIDAASSTMYSIERGLTEGDEVALPGAVELRDGLRVDSEVR